MIRRQPHLRILLKIAKKSPYFSKNLHTHNHARHPFDKMRHPDPSTASLRGSMLASLHRNDSLHALEIFKKQLQLGCLGNVDEVAVALAFKACKGDIVLGSQIHRFAVVSGFDSRTSVANSLMNMYCKSGEVDRALCIFQDLIEPDVVSWNTVLSGFRRSDDAFDFARRMNGSGVRFDAVTFTTALAFCSRDEEFTFGVQLHSLILKFALDCEVFVGNALISMYSRWGRLVEARRVFEEMPERDMVSWNAIISGYTQEGNYGLEAVSMFVEMVQEGVEVDHVSFTGALSACGHEQNLELGRQIHGLSIKRGCEKHISVSNVLMSTYSKCEVYGDAVLVFQNMEDRNVVSWTTMISIDEKDAVSLFNEMRADGVYPNDVTFIGLIHALTNRELVDEGKMVHGFCMRSGFLLESNVCNSLITMYAKFKLMEDSIKVFEELDYREMISWNALISGYAQNGMCQESIQTFFSALVECKPNQYSFGSVLSAIGTAENVSLKHGQRCHSQLVKLGLNTDPIVSGALLDMYAKRGSICESERVSSETPQRSPLSWTTIISAHARHGDYESVIKWFKEMEKQGIRPDSITFLSVLTACGRKGMVDMGRFLFESMVNDHHIEPSAEHYSCMVDMLGRSGRLEEAEELINCIPGGPGLSVLQSLLGACRIHGNLDIGERVADALVEMQPTDSGSYVLMSNLYAAKGQWDKAANVRRGMRHKGVIKEVGFSWVDVGNIDSLTLHGFSSGDKSHPQSEKICRMADFLGFEMKSLREGTRVRELSLQNFL
ncbi:hypothetical protein Tsubulata_023448 [Turnera subulata]|uniref:Pentacotripeptide-repeat region of PRORP domain-containing protein n=1 Tax=Turnera subulata TaxID=218843 RepID=A0A9Q0JKS8_9ROSI|nr:hypothetical protein Tsubulata_023448 [Turnera subulata]